MDDQLHIIVAGDRGNVVSLPCSRKKLVIITTISAVTFLALTITSIFSISAYTSRNTASNQLNELQEKLHSNEKLIAEYKKLNEAQRLELDLKVASLERDNIQQANAFKQEKETLISTAVGELNERSEIIEKIIGSIGIKIPLKTEESTKNSGGPFIKQAEAEKDDLLYKADKYVNTIRYLPFGKPVKGIVTSRFGKRKDPVNGKRGYHTGLDFRAKRGDKILATADGVVKKALRNGGYGNFVLIDHGNGYTTSFAHMQKYLVRKGDRVKRGQVIGLVGNTGRSTGPHLHYEICLDKKPVNPYTFMKIAKLNKSITSSLEKK